MTAAFARSAGALVLPPIRCQAGTVPLVSHPALPGVDVLPYVAHSLVFAQIAAAAVDVGDQLVMVDLPDRFNRHPGLLNVPLSMLPLVGVAVLPVPGRKPMAVAFTPASPPVVAALMARLQGRGLRCIAPPPLLEAATAGPAPNVTLPEDYRVYETGLERHFASAADALDNRFEALGARTQQLVTLRAARALRSARAAARKQRLLVVDWQLWWLMVRLLDGVLQDPSATLISLEPEPAKARPTLILVDPRQAWAAGALGDYPALTAAFFEEFLAGESTTASRGASMNVVPLPLRKPWTGVRPGGGRQPPFDLRARLDRLLVNSLTSDEPAPLPARERQAFANYLPRLMAGGGRALPRAAAHTLFAARACGGAGLAKRLREALLNYPAPPE